MEKPVLSQNHARDLIMQHAQDFSIVQARQVSEPTETAWSQNSQIASLIQLPLRDCRQMHLTPVEKYFSDCILHILSRNQKKNIILYF